MSDKNFIERIFKAEVGESLPDHKLEEKVVVSIYDVKASHYLSLMTFRTIPEALRAFGLICQQDQMISQYPEDYELHSLGVFNDVTGCIDFEKVELTTADSILKSIRTQQQEAPKEQKTCEAEAEPVES